MESIGKKIKNNRKYMGWNYFGAQGKIFNSFRNIITDIVGEFDKYADLTAGGGANLYQFVK